MFTLSAVPVKFIGLLILFCFTTAYELLRTVRSRTVTGGVSAGLHLLMSVIMLAMVPKSWWKPLQQVLPMPVTIVLMAVGLGWFCWLTFRAHPGHRMHPLGCAMMFAAMVWHLEAMQVMHSMMSHSTGNHMEMSSGGPTATPAMNHSGMDHSGMDHGSMGHDMGHASASPSPMAGMDHGSMGHDMAAGHDVMWWFAIIGLPLMAWLLYAAVKGLVTAIREPEHRMVGLADFAMNFGMFWMSTGLLVPVLPFFSALAF